MDYFCPKIQSNMDAVWYGIGDFCQWLFNLIRPFGRMANIFFITFGFVGTAFWLWYGEKTRKGGNNFLADKASKKS